MKKLLVLSLVLAMAAVSSAGLSMVYENGQIIVSSDEPLIGGVNCGLGIIGDGSFGEYQLRQQGAPGSVAEVNPWGDVTGYGFPWNNLVQFIWGEAVVEPNPAGMWIAFDIVANGEIQVDLTDSNFGVLQSMVIPEPMTMGLLGLGALFLRRRK